MKVKVSPRCSASHLAAALFWFDCYFGFCKLLVIQTMWKVGKDGIEAGTNLVPVRKTHKIIDLPPLQYRYS
jgi:hypothetical protein